jgi:tRNA 2-thiouridine synthesizing protein E
LGEIKMNEPGIITIVATAYLDDEGYLMPLERWDRNVGSLIARNVGLGKLTEDHWRIIEYIRGYYIRFGFVPPVKKLYRDTGFKLTSIYKLFPTGVARGACKVAGIPGTVFNLPQTCLYP